MQASSKKFSLTPTVCQQFDVLIIGGGQAGGRVAQGLREQGFQGTVAMVGREPRLPYERPPLSKAYLLGQTDEAALRLQTAEFWEEQGITIFLGCLVTKLDRAGKSVLLSDGRWLGYGELVVTTGGSPRELNAAGDAAGDVAVLRTLEDAQRIRSSLHAGMHLLIVGAGVIGLELASSAHSIGAIVEVIEAGAVPMGRILCPTAASWLTKLHRDAGVVIRTNTKLERIDHGEQAMQVTFTLEDGSEHTSHADLVVGAIGVSVAQSFLMEAGLGDEDGVEVDAHCRSVHDVMCYAAGDVAKTPGPYFGKAQRQETWRNAENQAKAVASAIMGATDPYVEIPWMWTDQHGHNIQVVGAPQPGMTSILRGELGKSPFSILWLMQGRLLGGVLVDSGRDRRVMEQLVKSQRVLEAESLGRTDVSLKSLL